MQIKIIFWFVTKQIVETQCVRVVTGIYNMTIHFALYIIIHLTAICDKFFLFYIILLKFG